MTDKKPVDTGQTPLSRADWDAATPRQQGFITYMQAEWNKAIPKKNPYPVNSKKHEQFQRGASQAVIFVQDEEENP